MGNEISEDKRSKSSIKPKKDKNDKKINDDNYISDDDVKKEKTKEIEKKKEGIMGKLFKNLGKNKRNKREKKMQRTKSEDNIFNEKENIENEEEEVDKIVKEAEKNNIKTTLLIDKMNSVLIGREKNLEKEFNDELENIKNEIPKDKKIIDINAEFEDFKEEIESDKPITKESTKDNYNINNEIDFDFNKDEQSHQMKEDNSKAVEIKDKPKEIKPKIFDPNAMDDEDDYEQQQQTTNTYPMDNLNQILPQNNQSVQVKYNNINNNIKNSNINKQFISKDIYAQVDKKELHYLVECLKKCNEKYETAMNFKIENNYFKSLEFLMKAKNAYLKLLKIVSEKEFNQQIPREFAKIVKIRIVSKLELTNKEIRIVMPLSKMQKHSIRKNLPTQISQTLNSPSLNKQNFKMVQKKNQPQYNSMLQPQSQSHPPQKQKQNIHDIEDQKAESKIESEIMSTKPDVKFSDIVGMSDLKQTIYEIIIMPTIRPDLFTGLREPIRGLLLFGPPGTGKTMIAKAIAGECESTFFNISASSLTSKWVGESEKTVRALFKMAYSRQPSIIFIDEIDSVLSKRSDSENEASKRLKTEFLIQFDGLGSNSQAKLLVIAATNRPMDLDDALKRRLPKRIYCRPLDKKGRADFVKKLVSSIQHTLTDREFDYIAENTNLYSNSDLHELCREAAYEPVRELTDEEVLKIDKFRPITIKDFEKALKKIRGTISQKVLKEIEDWNNQFGAI